MTAKTQRRWMQGILNATATATEAATVPMPWQRGAHRAAMLAGRKAAMLSAAAPKPRAVAAR